MTKTIVAIALPTIVEDLDGKDFIWVGTAFALAATALLPASGAFSEVRLSLLNLFHETDSSAAVRSTTDHASLARPVRAGKRPMWRSDEHVVAHRGTK